MKTKSIKAGERTPLELKDAEWRIMCAQYAEAMKMNEALCVKIQRLEKHFESLVTKSDKLNEAASLLVSEWNKTGPSVEFRERLNDLDFARKEMR